MNRMAIICDICGADVTPDEDTEISDYDIIKIQGDKICLCLDCHNAVYDWLQTPACKEYCKKHKEDIGITE